MSPIEHQLAHAVRDANGRAYNRTSHLPERHKMMQAWSDYSRFAQFYTQFMKLWQTTPICHEYSTTYHNEN